MKIEFKFLFYNILILLLCSTAIHASDFGEYLKEHITDPSILKACREYSSGQTGKDLISIISHYSQTQQITRPQSQRIITPGYLFGANQSLQNVIQNSDIIPIPKFSYAFDSKSGMIVLIQRLSALDVDPQSLTGDRPLSEAVSEALLDRSDLNIRDVVEQNAGSSSIPGNDESDRRDRNDRDRFRRR